MAHSTIADPSISIKKHINAVTQQRVVLDQPPPAPDVQPRVSCSPPLTVCATTSFSGADVRL